MANALVNIIIQAKDQASKAIAGLKSNLGKLRAGLNDTVEGLTGFNINTLAGAAGIGMLAKGVADAVKGYVAYADQVRELNRINGESSESNSRLIQLTDDLGLSVEELNTATTMAARQGIALSVDKLAAMSDEFLSLQNPIERNDYALQNFGRSGLGMIKVLEAGSTKIRDMSAAIASNMVLTDEQVQKARELEIAQDNLNDTWTGMKNTLAAELVPAMNNFLTTLQNGIDAFALMKNTAAIVTEVLNAHSQEVFASTSSYAEYRAEMERAIKVSGLLTQSYIKSKGGIDEAKASLGLLSEGVYEAIKADDGYIENSELFRAAIGENKGYVLELDEATGKLKDNTGLADQYMQSYSRNLLFNKAAQGLDADAALALAQRMGLVDEKTVEATRKTDEYRKMLESGEISLTEYNILVSGLADSLDRLHDKTVTVTYNQIVTGTAPNGYWQGQSTGDTGIGMRAGGGPVYAGNYYWTGERGPEPFIPAENGRILSHDDAMAALSASAFGNNSTGNTYQLSVYTTQSPEVVLRSYGMMRALAG